MSTLSSLGTLTGTTGTTGITGTTGTTGTTGGASYDTFVVGALIGNRDGIVGPEGESVVGPDPLQVGSVNNLELSGPQERANIFQCELLSRIGFSTDPQSRCITVQHLEIDPQNPSYANYQSLVTIVRPSKNVFDEQLPFLEQYADLRPDRAVEIVAQVGVPTAFFASIAFLHPERTRWTLELLFAALRLANFVVLRVKHALACRRPQEYSPRVQPIIQAPLHGTFPSGHATEAFIFALVLWRLLQAGGRRPYGDAVLIEQLMAQAARIAINRTVAGLHFPVDSAAGTLLGLTLADYFVSRCTGNDGYGAWKFDGEAYPSARDFYWSDFVDTKTGSQKPVQPYAVSGEQRSLAPSGHSDILRWFWDKAVDEWR